MFGGHYSDYYLVFYPLNVGWLLLLESTLPSIPESWLSLPGPLASLPPYPPHLFLGHWLQSRISSDRKYQVPFQKYHPLLLPLHLSQRPCHSGPPGWSPQCFGELGRIWTSEEAWTAVNRPSTHSSLPLYLVTVVHVVQFSVPVSDSLKLPPNSFHPSLFHVGSNDFFPRPSLALCPYFISTLTTLSSSSSRLCRRPVSTEGRGQDSIRRLNIFTWCVTHNTCLA